MELKALVILSPKSSGSRVWGWARIPTRSTRRTSPHDFEPPKPFLQYSVHFFTDFEACSRHHPATAAAVAGSRSGSLRRGYIK